jgi:hypothetical protein
MAATSCDEPSDPDGRVLELTDIHRLLQFDRAMALRHRALQSDARKLFLSATAVIFTHNHWPEDDSASLERETETTSSPDFYQIAESCVANISTWSLLETAPPFEGNSGGGRLLFKEANSKLHDSIQNRILGLTRLENEERNMLQLSDFLADQSAHATPTSTRNSLIDPANSKPFMDGNGPQDGFDRVDIQLLAIPLLNGALYVMSALVVFLGRCPGHRIPLWVPRLHTPRAGVGVNSEPKLTRITKCLTSIFIECKLLITSVVSLGVITFAVAQDNIVLRGNLNALSASAKHTGLDLILLYMLANVMSTRINMLLDARRQQHVDIAAAVKLELNNIQRTADEERRQLQHAYIPSDKVIIQGQKLADRLCGMQSACSQSMLEYKCALWCSTNFSRAVDMLACLLFMRSHEEMVAQNKVCTMLSQMSPFLIDVIHRKYQLYKNAKQQSRRMRNGLVVSLFLLGSTIDEHALQFIAPVIGVDVPEYAYLAVGIAAAMYTVSDFVKDVTDKDAVDRLHVQLGLDVRLERSHNYMVRTLNAAMEERALLDS